MSEKMTEFFTALRTRNANLNQDVRNAVVEELYQEKVAASAVKLRKGLQKLDTLRGDLQKLEKPDQQTFNADGSVAASTYSKERIEALNKARKALSNHEQAMEAALNGDFGRLN